MLQKVTLGYFERDEAGRMLSRSREVVVEAASGDDAAAKALAEHGPGLERFAGYDPGQTTGRVAVLGVDTPPAGGDLLLQNAGAPKESAPKAEAKKGKRPR
jgi:hypothetical protein